MVTEAALAAALATLGTRWTIEAGELVLALRGGTMTSHAPAVAAAAALADELDHHPVITLEYAGLTLRIHTHDAAALTELDLTYATRLETWLRANGHP